jgi:hypothetical protein
MRGIAAQKAPGSAQHPSKTRSFMSKGNTPNTHPGSLLKKSKARAGGDIS